MTSLTLRVAAGAAAVLTAAALTGCGSASTGSPAASPATHPAASPSAASAFNATDLAFTSGILRLEGQAQALGNLAAGQTSSTQLRRYAAQLGGGTYTQHMSDMMHQWHQATPPPYQPGANLPSGMGPGMMTSRDWADMHHHYGQDFNDHWLGVMMSNRTAELTLCRDELRTGASPQAKSLARSMLAERQAQLAQLQQWHHAIDHNGQHQQHNGP